jgi:hypothetical protein
VLKVARCERDTVPLDQPLTTTTEQRCIHFQNL